MEPKPVGGQWLKERLNLVNYTMTHSSYIASTPDIRLTSKGNIEQYYGLRYAVKDENNPLHHIEFYLKYDDINLDFLQSVFKNISEAKIEAYVDETPAGKSERRIGFLFEFLMPRSLNLKQAVGGNYTDLLDEEKYFVGETIKNTRWRINNNLLGDKDYCPIVRRTAEIRQLLSQELIDEIENLKANYPEIIFLRATNYLYTKETKSSYEIERETPSLDRTQKFIEILKKTGSESNEEMLSKHRLITLQNAIVDPRYANTDFRDFQNYVGQSTGWDQEYYHYICPPPGMVGSVMNGLKNLAIKTASKTPAEIRAGIISFGFVFIHPFEDGNGRIHRFLIHDVLAHDQIVPSGLIIPVSAHMLNNMKEYDAVLEKYSKPLMSRIKFNISDNGKITISNSEEVEGYFRYPDLTAQCAYLLTIIHNTIKEDMPQELIFIYRFEEAKKAIQAIVDMPDKKIRDLLTFLHQNKGTLAKKRRGFFEELTDEEIQEMEKAYKEIYQLN